MRRIHPAGQSGGQRSAPGADCESRRSSAAVTNRADKRPRNAGVTRQLIEGRPLRRAFPLDKFCCREHYWITADHLGQDGQSQIACSIERLSASESVVLSLGPLVAAAIIWTAIPRFRTLRFSLCAQWVWGAALWVGTAIPGSERKSVFRPARKLVPHRRQFSGFGQQIMLDRAVDRSPICFALVVATMRLRTDSEGKAEVR